jgi:hypothetical protein
MNLSERIRPGSEAAPWVIEEVKKLERALEQAWGLAASDWTVEGESNDALCRALHGSGCPDLAEWLKNKGSK